MYEAYIWKRKKKTHKMFTVKVDDEFNTKAPQFTPARDTNRQLYTLFCSA